MFSSLSPLYSVAPNMLDRGPLMERLWERTHGGGVGGCSTRGWKQFTATWSLTVSLSDLHTLSAAAVDRSVWKKTRCHWYMTYVRGSKRIKTLNNDTVSEGKGPGESMVNCQPTVDTWKRRLNKRLYAHGVCGAGEANQGWREEGICPLKKPAQWWQWESESHWSSTQPMVNSSSAMGYKGYWLIPLFITFWCQILYSYYLGATLCLYPQTYTSKIVLHTHRGFEGCHLAGMHVLAAFTIWMASE